MSAVKSFVIRLLYLHRSLEGYAGLLLLLMRTLFMHAVCVFVRGFVKFVSGSDRGFLLCVSVCGGVKGRRGLARLSEVGGSLLNKKLSAAV